MKKLSLIIPVYNVEKYVARCIQSCINQNISSVDYEIIIINDGSTDSSLQIVNALVKDRDNITFISQKNEGLSSARNKGLSLAKGEYIWFIDSDDWIEINCLEDIFNKLDKIEVLAMGYIEAYDDFQKNKKVFASNIPVTNGIELLHSTFIIPAQFYIYRRSFLEKNNLFFEPGVFHEDFEFTPRMLYFANKLMRYNKQIYFFYKRPGSITTSVNPKKSFDLIKIALNLISFEKKNVKQADKYIFHNMVWLALNNALHNSLIMDNKTRNEFKTEFFNNRWIFKYLNLSTVFKYRIERILFMIFPKYTTIIYQLLKSTSK